MPRRVAGLVSVSVPSPVPTLGEGNQAQIPSHNGYSEVADPRSGTRVDRPEAECCEQVGLSRPVPTSSRNHRKVTRVKSRGRRRRTGTKGRSGTEPLRNRNHDLQAEVCKKARRSRALACKPVARRARAGGHSGKGHSLVPSATSPEYPGSGRNNRKQDFDLRKCANCRFQLNESVVGLY